jgi:hypothetical protein
LPIDGKARTALRRFLPALHLLRAALKQLNEAHAIGDGPAGGEMGM